MLLSDNHERITQIALASEGLSLTDLICFVAAEAEEQMRAESELVILARDFLTKVEGKP